MKNYFFYYFETCVARQDLVDIKRKRFVRVDRKKEETLKKEGSEGDNQRKEHKILTAVMSAVWVTIMLLMV